MTSLGVGIVLLALVVSAESVGFRGFNFDSRKEPQVFGWRARNTSEKWIEQPVDHFDPRNNRTWSMRYYENNGLYNGTGPILIMLGGEWAIAPGFVQTGQMYKIGVAHGAMMYYTEHRYYGESHPTNNTKSESLRYLSVDQSLADVAYFIETRKREVPGLANSSVIVFGGSYAGNMAAWARIKYPHLIQGAVASSAPVRAKADFFEYYSVVASALGRYSEQCVTDVKDAFDGVEILLNNGAYETIKKIFSLCDAPIDSPSSLAYFVNVLTEQFAGTVQYNAYSTDNSSDISRICDIMMNKNAGTPVQRLASIVSRWDRCLDVSYENFVEEYNNSSWNSPANTMRLWYYQTCTEYGYYQTTSSKNSIFGSLVPLDFYVKLCEDFYGKYYDSGLLDWGVTRTNLMYGGSLPDVTNVIFVNGNTDPWHALSVLEDLNKDSPAILIDRSSHCQDLYDDSPADVEGLGEARARVRSIVSQWLTAA